MILTKKNEHAVRITAQIDKILPNSVKETKLQLIREVELKLCCYICEHDLSLSLMNTFPDFCKSVYVDSEIAKEIKLKRKKTTQLIVGHLGPNFKNEIVNDLRRIHFSIIIDETTDICMKKCLVIVVRYWKNESVYDRFLDLIETESGTAEGIFNVLKKMFDDNDIPYNNIIGFASDNVSVMMGNLKGVQSRVKRELQPNVFVQGCSCHSLHLCSSAAAKKLPGTVEQFARDIYSYFAYSSKRTAALREFQVFANEKLHKMLHPSQTRWLSLQAVVDRILEHWNSLQLFFQREALEENLPSGKQILNALTNHMYKLYLLFLSYVLKLINTVNVELQSSQSKVPLMLGKIKSLYKTFIKCFIKKEVIEDFERKSSIDKINVTDPHNYIPIESTYFGAKVDALLKQDINIHMQELTSFKLRCLEFYTEICTQIKERFDFSDKILSFASNFIPETACEGSIRSIAEFINFFPHIEVDIEAANIEWNLMVEASFDKETKENINAFWRAVQIKKNVLGEPMFPNLMIIVRVIMSLPHSSAINDKMALYEGGSIAWKPDKALLQYKKESIENVPYNDEPDM
ncbi:protein FAM200B-like [Leptinotarsa decemlineata]|uniref:protein FAM200B-like n=1 Tax=Leptinotarsa decemlineata TaxID=7539 RepID=UPI003D309AD6